jgi:hypothetical protein
MKIYPADELLGLSLEFEKNAQAVYQDWAEKFVAWPDVAAFWCEYAADEAFHIRLLEQFRSRLSPDQLAAPIESDLVIDIKRLLVSLRQAHDIEDLEQAYQLANMIEHSEVNPLFETIVEHFETQKEEMDRLHSKLDAHIDKLIYRFPKRFARPEFRREVKV